jgi:signal transduction histidine kinase
VILDRIAGLLSDPQGSLAYHLIATFTIGLIFLLALAHRRQAGASSLRWMIASGPLAAARLGLLLLAASTAVAAPELAPMLSPLERYLAVAGGLAVAWAFLFPRPQRSGDLGFGAALALCSLGLAASALPLATGGVSTGLAAAWDLAGLLAMLAAVGVLLARRPIAWPAAAGGLGLLGMGFGLQLAFESASETTGAALRFAELLGYPALGAAAAWALAALSRDGLPQGLERPAQPHPTPQPQLMPEATLKGIQAAAAGDGPRAPRAGSQDSEQVAQLKAEFRLALQELADLSRDRGSGGPAGNGVPAPVVGSLGEVVQSMRRALTSVLSRAELLGADPESTEQVGLLDQLRQDVQRLAGQVNKLGELTSESAAQAISGAAATDLLGCLHRALEQLAGPIRQKKLTFSTEVPEHLPPVRARQAELERLLSMMVESAITSTFPGSEIRVRAGLEPGSLISLSVADAGQGFSPEEVAQAFQPWHQLEGPSSGGTRALGISLAGLRKNAEQLGGRVWVASELGAGTTITVLLPASPGDPSRA